MRRLERWLHQHIFKVGWLITRRLTTTTIIYYLLFLPGIVLYEATVWLTATFINVRAEIRFGIPAEQSAAELKLEFVRLARTISRTKQLILGLTPVLTGLLVIWLIANQALALGTLAAPISVEGLAAAPQVIGAVTAQPGFWLWALIIFAVANTMFPSDGKLARGWRPLLLVIGAIVVIAVVTGVGREALGQAVEGPIYGAATALAETLVFVIAIDLIATAALGLIEAVIERVTGSSATFQNGKLIALTREQVQKQKAQQREKQVKAESTREQTVGSIYDLPFPLPQGPAREQEAAQTPQVVVVPPPAPAGRAGAGLIESEPLRVDSRPLAEPNDSHDDDDHED